MLACSLLLLVGAFVLYVEVPALLIYWTYPWPVYAMLVAAVAIAMRSKRRGALRVVTIGVCGAVTTLFLLYTLAFSQLNPSELTVRPGDRFPDFTLQTSTKELFSPSQLTGQSAALYIFYRGDW